MSPSDIHDVAVGLALIAGGADKPPDPTVVLLIEQALRAVYEAGASDIAARRRRRRSRKPTEPENDREIVLAIQALLDAAEWTPGTLEEIVELLRRNGYPVARTQLNP
jgi:hypothetical protein